MVPYKRSCIYDQTARGFIETTAVWSDTQKFTGTLIGKAGADLVKTTCVKADTIFFFLNF